MQIASLSKKLKNGNEDVMEYASVVGRSLSQKMLLYRC